MAKPSEPPIRTLTPPPLPGRLEPPIATFLVGNAPRLGVTETGQGGLYYGRESSVEEGEDSEEEGSDGEYEDSDALPWPPELLHRPQRQRRRPLPRKGAEEGISASVQREVQSGIAPMQGDAHTGQGRARGRGSEVDGEEEREGEPVGGGAWGTGAHWAQGV
jgi:hypothetical protein